MTTVSRRQFLSLSGAGAVALAFGPKLAAAGALTPTRPGRRVRVSERLEFALDGLPAVANPFDPNQIDVWAHFVDPTGAVSRVPAFFFQDYTRRQLANGRERLTAAGPPAWKVRFTPTRPGRWRWRWTARLGSGEQLHGATEQVIVEGHRTPGFIRVAEHDRRYLVRDDGSPYFAIGENVGWYDAGGTYDYDRWFDRLAAQSSNFARIWMPSWAFALEAPGSPLGDYTTRLDRAWQLDHVFDLAQASGLALMLTLQNHGPFSLAFNSEWAQNPYNAANGGPLARPQDFFTDATALELFRRRLRYCVARWSYAPHLLAWELWNEVDLTGGYDQGVVTAWHRDMAAYLRLLDPNDHLVTTSMAFYPSVVPSPENGRLWNEAGLDFTQVHRYTTLGSGLVVGDGDVSRDLPTLVHEMLERHPGPTIVAEYGVNSDSADETAALDPAGIALHDALWSSALSGAFGAAMTWWWDTYIDDDPTRFYPMFGALARYVDGVRWDRQAFVATSAVANAPDRNLRVVGLDGRDVRLVWIKNDDHQWNDPDTSVVEHAVCDLATHAPGSWNTQWWDTTTGTPIGSAQTRDGHLVVPPFIGDIALRVSRANGRRAVA
jgi:hypothetical protein